MLTALSALGVLMGWLLQLPAQPGFVYDEADTRFVLMGYVDFVFLAIVTVTIVLIINRSTYLRALQKPAVTQYDRLLFGLMYNLPLVLICTLCGAVLFAIFTASLSIGYDYSVYF